MLRHFKQAQCAYATGHVGAVMDNHLGDDVSAYLEIETSKQITGKHDIKSNMHIMDLPI